MRGLKWKYREMLEKIDAKIGVAWFEWVEVEDIVTASSVLASLQNQGVLERRKLNVNGCHAEWRITDLGRKYLRCR